jgi:hypothetical protein
MTKSRPARAATRPEPTPDRSIHQFNQFNIAGGSCQELTQIITIPPVIRTTPGAPAALVPHGPATLVTARAEAFPPGGIGGTGRDAKAFEPDPDLRLVTFFCRCAFFSSTQRPEIRLTIGVLPGRPPALPLVRQNPEQHPLFSCRWHELPCDGTMPAFWIWRSPRCRACGPYGRMRRLQAGKPTPRDR